MLCIAFSTSNTPHTSNPETSKTASPSSSTSISRQTCVLSSFIPVAMIVPKLPDCQDHIYSDIFSPKSMQYSTVLPKQAKGRPSIVLSKRGAKTVLLNTMDSHSVSETPQLFSASTQIVTLFAPVKSTIIILFSGSVV